MRAVVRTLLLLLAVSVDVEAQRAPAQTLAPAVTLQRLDGSGELDLRSYIGRTPVLLHFFAAWCSMCGSQMPSLHAAVARHGKAVKFVGIAVSANQSLERARRYAQTHGLTHELLYDARGEAVEAYDVPTTSYVVVIDRSGQIVFTGSGADLDIAAAAARALGADAPRAGGSRGPVKKD